MFVADTTDPGAILKVVYAVIGFLNLALPTTLVISWLVYALLFSGFPYRSAARRAAWVRLSRLVGFWTVGRVAWAVVSILAANESALSALGRAGEAIFTSFVVLLFLLAELLPALAALGTEVLATFRLVSAKHAQEGLVATGAGEDEDDEGEGEGEMEALGREELQLALREGGIGGSDGRGRAAVFTSAGEGGMRGDAAFADAGAASNGSSSGGRHGSAGTHLSAPAPGSAKSQGPPTLIPAAAAALIGATMRAASFSMNSGVPVRNRPQPMPAAQPTASSGLTTARPTIMGAAPNLGSGRLADGGLSSIDSRRNSSRSFVSADDRQSEC